MISLEKSVSTWQFPVNKVIKFGPCWEAPYLWLVTYWQWHYRISWENGGRITKTPALIAGAPFPFPSFVLFSLPLSLPFLRLPRRLAIAGTTIHHPPCTRAENSVNHDPLAVASNCSLESLPFGWQALLSYLNALVIRFPDAFCANKFNSYRTLYQNQGHKGLVCALYKLIRPGHEGFPFREFIASFQNINSACHRKYLKYF